MIFQFNQITLDTGQYQLCLSGNPIPVEPQVFDLLAYLIENRERVVTRDELLEKLWQDKVVTDAELGVTLQSARKTVGDSGHAQIIIKTIHGRGYQFIAEVTESTTGELQGNNLDAVLLELPDHPSIAVLPFANMSGDPEQEFFSDGITEDIITALSRISRLLVVARTSTLGYKGKAIDVKQVGQEQGVGYVLEGSVRKNGNRVRVTAQLIDATTGHHCWADHYDRELDDIFSVQDEITKNITVALQVTLTEGEQARVYAGGTKNVEAWECLVRGKGLMERHIKEDNFAAQRLLERAVQLDPEYVTPWAYLGWAYLGWTHWEAARWQWGETPESSLDCAFESAQTALEMEREHPDSLALLGLCYLSRGENDLALSMTENAFTLAPNHAYITAVSAVVLRGAGRIEDAIRRIKRAMRLSPIYPMWYLMVLGSVYHLLGDQSAAVATLRESVQREPESILPKPWYLSALIQADLEEEAKMVAADIMRIELDFSRTSWIQYLGIDDLAVTTKLSENLAKAGLPE